MGLVPWTMLAVVFLVSACGLWPRCLFRAWTGLPCPFCGGTRALRALARGDWVEALYHNPLALGVVAAAVLWSAWWWTEAVWGRAWPRAGVERAARRAGPVLLVGLGVFWGVHVALAVILPKPELLDAGGWVWRLWGR
jgi:Na+-driven multidrug efflux pump